MSKRGKAPRHIRIMADAWLVLTIIILISLGGGMFYTPLLKLFMPCFVSMIVVAFFLIRYINRLNKDK